ncbi:hypothetical protein ACFE04_009922 [Oxalis oulophora]
MASISHCLTFPPFINCLKRSTPKSLFTPNCLNPNPIPISISSHRTRPTSTAAATISNSKSGGEEAMSIENLQSFINLNLGKWQFDGCGNLMQKISTRLSTSSYGEDELSSLIQTLYIQQPLMSGYDEPEWAEYKIKETNMFTVDKYQQIGFFPSERAFALRYQTAGMLDTVLRQGVLGEDDTGEESPKNLKLPSRRPSIVCESCLYSQENDRRARAFHIMDPSGVIEMLLVFFEEKGDGVLSHPSLDNAIDSTDRLVPILGKWKGYSLTRRSGVYGGTIAKADTIALLEMDDKGQLIQNAPAWSDFMYNLLSQKHVVVSLDTTSTAESDGRDVTTNVHLTGTISNNLITFEGGYQITLLPGGMFMGCPCDISKCLSDSKPFSLEFGWVETPGKRERLIRTYDVEGLAVSTTYFSETKV